MEDQVRRLAFLRSATVAEPAPVDDRLSQSMAASKRSGPTAH